MKKIKMLTGHEIPLDGDLLYVLESLYREVSLKRELKATFDDLMNNTKWDEYGYGKDPRCEHCMVHCGYEPTAVNETVAHPLRALKVWLRGIRTAGPMAPELELKDQRSAEYVFDHMVQRFMSDTHTGDAGSDGRRREKSASKRSNAA